MVSMSFSVNSASLLHLPLNWRGSMKRHLSGSHEYQTYSSFPSLCDCQSPPSWWSGLIIPAREDISFLAAGLTTNPEWLGSICNLKFNVPWWKQLLPGIRACKAAGTESTKSTLHFTESHCSGTTPISTLWILDSGISCVEDWTPYNDHWFRLYTPSWRMMPHPHRVSSPSWPLNYTLPSFYQTNYVAQEALWPMDPMVMYSGPYFLYCPLVQCEGV